MEKKSHTKSNLSEKKKLNYPSVKKNTHSEKVFDDLRKRINEVDLSENKNNENNFLSKTLTKRNFKKNSNKNKQQLNNTFTIDINKIQKEIIKEDFEKKNQLQISNQSNDQNSSINFSPINQITFSNSKNNKPIKLKTSSSYVKIYYNKNNYKKSSEKTKSNNKLFKNLINNDKEKNEIKKMLFDNNNNKEDNKDKKKFTNLNKISKTNKKNNEVRMLYNICLFRKSLNPQNQINYYNEQLNSNSFIPSDERNSNYHPIEIIHNEPNQIDENNFKKYKTNIKHFDIQNKLIPEEKENITETAKELIEQKNRIINQILSTSGINIKI